MSVASIIDPQTGKISLNYLPEGQQGFITNVTSGNNDIITSVSPSGVATVSLNQNATLQTVNATQEIRLGDEARLIDDQVILDQTGMTVTNGDITIENGNSVAILQSENDRLLCNGVSVAYTSELPTVAITNGPNITVVNNSSGSDYSFQISATGDLGVVSVTSADNNIVIAGTAENPTVGLAGTIEVDQVTFAQLPASLELVALDGALQVGTVGVEGYTPLALSTDIPPLTNAQSGTYIDVSYFEENAFTINNTMPVTSITAGAGLSVANPTTNQFTITNTVPATSITAGTGISVSNPGTNQFTISNSGVTGLTAGTGVSVSAASGNVTISNTGVGAVNAGANISVSGLQSSRQVALSNNVNITSGNSFNFNTGSNLQINSLITNATPANNSGNVITIAPPLVSDGTSGPSAGLAIQTYPNSATNGNTILSMIAPDNKMSYAFYAPATTGNTSGTVAGQINLWGYPTSSSSPFYHSFNPNQSYQVLTIAPDGSTATFGNNNFTQAPNTGMSLYVAGTDSAGNLTSGQVYDTVFNKPPTATPPTINGGTGISVANPSPNTYTITNTQAAPNLTAGANITISNPSSNNFTIASSVPQFGAGTSSSSNTLYENANFGSQNVSIPLSAAINQSGLYCFQCNVNNFSTGPGQVQPQPGGGAIYFFMTGTGVQNQAGSSLYISSYDCAAVGTGLVAVTKQFYITAVAGSQFNFNIRPYDANNQNNFGIWNIGVEVKVFYMGAITN